MTVEATDDRLLSRAVAGEPAALAELFERYGQQVLDLAHRITGSRDDAEDVLQDLFVGMPEALRGYDGAGSLGAWLRRLATRAALLRLRGERRRARRQHDAAAEALTPDAAGKVEARMILERWLGRMPSDLRVVLVLKEVEGYSHAEIGELLGISRAASEVRLHRARRFLKERLRSRL